MAPRKTRKSPEIAVSNEEHAAAQTQVVNNDQIEYYKKQIILLQKELETCKNQILELQSENKILKDTNINALNNDAAKISLNQKNLYGKVRNNKVLSPSPLAKSKGCSCKGNCSSKICGCVKKGIICQEFCRCNDVQCQNQELDKENVEQATLSSDGQKALEKLNCLTLNQETLHASEKKIKKSIFSPYVTKSFQNGSEERSYPASPLVFETRRKLFTHDSDDLVDVETNTSEHETDELANKLESQSIKSPVSKQTGKSNISEKTSNETGKLKNLAKTLDEATTTKSVDKSESLQVKGKKKVEPEKNTKSKNVKQSRKPPIVVHNDEDNSKDEVFVSEEQSKIPKSPCVLRRKSKSISPDCNIVKRKYDKLKGKAKARSVSPTESIATKNDSEKNLPKLGKVQHSPQPYIASIKNVENIDNENNDKPMNEIKIQSEEIAAENSFESHTSGNTSNSSNHNGIIDSSINPMVPKRQLARSPISAGTVIVALDKKRFSPPAKIELAAEEVDWEQHQKELVPCKKCKRKFWPHRLDTHVKSCKKI